MPLCRRLAEVGALAGVAVVAGGCSSGFDFGAPDAVTSQGQDVLDLWRGTHWAAAAVGALIWLLVVFCVLHYRRRNDDLPSQGHENIPVEVFYTVTPLIVVAVLFVFTVLTQQRVVALSADPDVVVDVTGFQWSWQFDYPEEEVTVLSNGVDPPRIVLPVGATVRFNLVSPDVNHSFWVPRFLVKRDLIPGVENAIEVEVTEAGEWEGRCAEFCGIDHYRMSFSVAAVPPDEYADWLDEQQETPVTSLPADTPAPATPTEPGP